MVAVVVPIYRQSLTKLEYIAYRQLINILGEFDIIFMAPEKLIISPEINEKEIKFEYFDQEFFESINAYNRLMLSEHFYKRFIEYQFILIYQLDAFVFKNELQYFCDLGYDYIGAPWPYGFWPYTLARRKPMYVGNGGFSLRRVAACIEALNFNKELIERYKEVSEDVFFSACNSANFKVAPVDVALCFSFETDVRSCFEANNNHLPFGCHAWPRYNLDFWKKYIEEFGYTLDENNLARGMEDLRKRDGYLWQKRNALLLEKDDLFYAIPQKIKSLFHSEKKGGYYLWGSGTVGKYVKELFRDLGIHIEGFIDMNPKKQGKELDGYKIYAPDKIEKGKGIIVSVMQKHWDEIKECLQEMNMIYLEDYIFFDDILPDLK